MNRFPRCLLALGFIAAAFHCAECAFAEDADKSGSPKFSLGKQNGRVTVVVRGINAAKSDKPWLVIHAVKNKSASPDSKRGMLGAETRGENKLEFVPRFAFRPGQTYRVQLRNQPSAIWHFTIPRPQSEPAKIVGVYPSGNRVPENLLRVYIQFSKPMSRGQAYKNLALLDERGNAVKAPFLELQEELWNKSGTRFTLLFDPGRVKQGLKPREEDGAVLAAGYKYTLVIRAAWQDAAGNRLPREFRRTWSVEKPDVTQPDPTHWQLEFPRSATAPLRVRFREPLDYAQLQRLISVRFGGKVLSGSITIGKDERNWEFRPNRPWPKGKCLLVVKSHLEDRCGNSPQRPFELDLSKKKTTPILPVPPTIQLPFFPSR